LIPQSTIECCCKPCQIFDSNTQGNQGLSLTPCKEICLSCRCYSERKYPADYRTTSSYRKPYTQIMRICSLKIASRIGLGPRKGYRCRRKHMTLFGRSSRTHSIDWGCGSRALAPGRNQGLYWLLLRWSRSIRCLDLRPNEHSLLLSVTFLAPNGAFKKSCHLQSPGFFLESPAPGSFS